MHHYEVECAIFRVLLLSCKNPNHHSRPFRRGRLFFVEGGSTGTALAPWLGVTLTACHIANGGNGRETYKGVLFLKIIRKKIDELIPAGYNPRKTLTPGDAEYEQIKQSILTFGLVEPVVWNSRTGNVVGGHQRLVVLRDLGHEEIDVSVVDLSETQEKSLNIALNKIMGEWDDEKLTALLEELAADADEMMLGLTGFTDEELSEIFATEYVDTAIAFDGDDELPPSREARFTYQEQFGVIVICKDEGEQQSVYETLTAQGFSCKVVAT